MAASETGRPSSDGVGFIGDHGAEATRKQYFVPVICPNESKFQSARRTRRGRSRPSLAALILVATAGAALFAFGSGAARTSAGADAPVVTLIGDSVAYGLDLTAEARLILRQGIDLKLEVAPCRRVVLESCPYNGVRPLSVLELVKARGRGLGPTVIVFVGHNDRVDQYADDIETALAELEHAGVERVLWSTLRASRQPYVTMNDAIQAAAQKHPSMSVIEWNVYSRSHPEWFQPDGIHLNHEGGVAMATLFRAALVRLGIPLPPPRILTSRFSDAHKGSRYSARVVASGGKGPYSWSFTRLPKGVRASGSGQLDGRPVGPLGTYSVGVRVIDSRGSIATREIRLRLRR